MDTCNQPSENRWHIVLGENQCRILDKSDRVVFTGTWRQAEAWLDYQENLAREPDLLPRPAPSRMRALMSSVRDIFSLIARRKLVTGSRGR
jgi:hypothetical protein